MISTISLLCKRFHVSSGNRILRLHSHRRRNGGLRTSSHALRLRKSTTSGKGRPSVQQPRSNKHKEFPPHVVRRFIHLSSAAVCINGRRSEPRCPCSGRRLRHQCGVLFKGQQRVRGGGGVGPAVSGRVVRVGGEEGVLGIIRIIL